MAHHHHHHRDGASRFRDRSLRAIEIRRKVGKWLKIVLLILAVFMVLLVLASYFFTDAQNEPPQHLLKNVRGLFG
jgi:hypothetical protein